MVLTIYGRKSEDPYIGDVNDIFGLLGKSLQSLVAEVIYSFDPILFYLSYETLT